MTQINKISAIIPFRETLMGLAYDMPGIRNVSISIEPSFFTVLISFKDSNGSAVDITGYVVSEITNLYIYEEALIFSDSLSEGVLRLRPASFGVLTKFKVSVPGYQKVSFGFVSSPTEVSFIINLNKIISSLYDSDANVYIPAKADDPENDIIL